MENFNHLDWSEEARSDSLNTVYNHVLSEARGNIDWYTARAKGRKQRAQTIRITALIALGFGTLVPVIIDLLSPTIDIPASLATLILAFGSGLMAFDRFMGYSSGWMRFLLTEMMLKAKLEAFQFQWVIENASRKDSVISDDDLINTLNRFASFRADTLKVVQDETQLWVEEFQTNLKTLDENFKSMAEVTRSGVISVKIDGVENYTGGWDLLMDDTLVESSTSSSTAIKDVIPGFRKLTLIGKDASGTELKRATDIITVTPGSHISATFSLPALDEKPIKESDDLDEQ